MAIDPSVSALPRRWANPRATSLYTGIPLSSLATWRCILPKRIPFHRVGRKILYDLNEVDAALARRES
jgi:hypothetical protein